ncbi:MAG TPA: hypothetical protein VFY67_01050 [Pyrinomonadaceae bacterium]|nr:hypothetical protein [Pyrinomonadaceae bacterium]
MARAKRFYLCNLIPLWEIDDDHLEVDWTQEAAKNGEIVEMRVVVKDLDLNMTTPDFTIEFEVNENDVLLFGGLDDRVVTITNKAAEKKTEHRDISIIGANDAVPADQRLTKIFLSPVSNAAPQKLIRAFWPAAWQDDVAGEPEYYFDVKLEFTGKTFKERSDRELAVSKENFVLTPGAPTTGAPATGTLVLPAVGWSARETFAEQSVDQLALLDPANTGKPVSFAITPDASASLFWIVLVPKSIDASPGGALIKKSWTVPRFLPLENIRTLSLKALVDGKSVSATTVAKADAETFPGQTGGLFAELTLDEGRPVTTPPEPSITVNEQQQRANAFLTAESTLKARVDTELATWATANSKNITPTHSDYAFTLQEFAMTLTHVDSEIIPRPASGSALTRWRENFRKSYVLGLMIMASGSGVTQREERTNQIAFALAEANFVTEALTLADLFSARERQEFPYETALKHGNLTATQWTTVLNFLTAGTGTFAETDLAEAFGFTSGSVTVDGVTTHRLLPTTVRAFIARLATTDGERTSRLDAITTALINAYANDPNLIWVLAGFLFFHLPFRQPFSDKMWSSSQNYLLFKIVNALDFNEPEYDNPTWDGVTLTLARDMTWVYQNKQRFAVDFLVSLCDRAGTPIPRPANLSFNSLRAWLEAQTETIAASAPVIYPDSKNHWFALYNFITDVFFFHVDLGDVRPDLLGHIGHLGPSEPGGLRMRADCDVFAAYGTRFLRAMGFTSVGYMGIMPIVARPVGHAGALLQKDGAYFIVNNKAANRIAAATEAEAHVKLRDELLDVLRNPARYEVYYAPSDATGGMSPRIRQLGDEIRRRDLEP